MCIILYSWINCCFLVFLLNTFLVTSVRRARSSATFIFLSSSSVNWWAIEFSLSSSRIVLEILGTFFAASCFPPSTQNGMSLFTYCLFSRWRSLNSSCLFSTSSRFVAASQWLILQWKNLLRSSFFFSAPSKNWKGSCQFKYYRTLYRVIE